MPPNFSFNTATIRSRFAQKVFSIVSVSTEADNFVIPISIKMMKYQEIIKTLRGLSWIFNDGKATAKQQQRRKVNQTNVWLLTLLSFQAQLTLTLGFVALFTFHQGALEYAYNNQWLLTLSMISTIGLTLLMSFSQAARRTAPLNLILLGAYTLSQGFMVGILSSFYQVDEVVYAIGITCAIVFGLTIYASTTKEDFTMKGGMMMSALMALSIGSLVSIFYRGDFFNFILACGGAAVFSMYIIYDLQMIVGDRKLKISEEEYIFAALNLYVDIIRIFMELLKILRYLNENSNNQQKKKRN